jgi:hypothetical protein
MKYYKVKLNSQTHEKLNEIFDRMATCNKACIEIIDEVGASGGYQSKFDKAGGIYAFSFEGNVPEGWRKAGDGYYPKANIKANKPLLRKIEKLPIVSIIEWADIFKSDIFRQPGCFKSGDQYFANGYNIVGEDFVEIKMSEWAIAKEAIS